MDAPSICLCIAEDDLRTWVIEELALITWVTSPTIVTTTLSAIDPATTSVVIVGVDRLAPRDLDHLRGRTWRTPVIAIGGGVDLRADHALGPRLTSRELKQALRATLLGAATHESAAG